MMLMNEETIIGACRDFNSGMQPYSSLDNKNMDTTLGMMSIMPATIEDHYVTMNSASTN